MKCWTIISYSFVLAVLFYFNISAQNIQYAQYPNIYELRGLEDYNGTTNLFYRINSTYNQGYLTNSLNSIYHFKVQAGIDTLLLPDHVAYDLMHTENSIEQYYYDFFNKDPQKLIHTFGSGAIDYTHILNAYFAEGIYNAAIYPITFISTYKNNDTTFAFAYKSQPNDQNLFIKYKGYNGSEHLFDTLGTFNAISHSPYNDNVYFGDSNGALYKSVNEGITQYLADNTPGWSGNSRGKIIKTIYYDKNQNYIYRIARAYQNNRLMISDNAGEPGSWSLKYTSPNEIFLAADDSTAGLVYLADGLKIYRSTNYGNTFSEYKTLDYKVTGIYKKPGTDKLYASTAHRIYEITSGGVTTIKLLFEKDQLKFDPLSVGNKWVYKGYNQSNGSVISTYMKVKEVLKDTTINSRVFKKIMYTTIAAGMTTRYEYQSIDTATGLVYMLNPIGTVVIAEDLNLVVGDTINYSRYFFDNQLTVLNGIGTFNQFNTSTTKRNYITTGTGIGYTSYSLANGLGFIYLREEIEDNASIDSIKGCTIDGIVYGDTNRVVGIFEEDPYLVPDDYALYQNYPNPFNPSTVIEYGIPEEGKVTLKIYDLMGREVSQLVNETKAKGYYKVQFNASGLSSGIYFYKLQSGGFTQVRKFMLLK